MKVFISGPMTGYENYNREAFYKAEEILKNMGLDVFNPAWLKWSEGWKRWQMWNVDTAAVKECDILLLLPGWSDSNGCAVECECALQNKKIIVEVHEITDLAFEIALSDIITRRSKHYRVILDEKNREDKTYNTYFDDFKKHVVLQTKKIIKHMEEYYDG